MFLLPTFLFMTILGAQSANVVNIALYYEVLCPYSIQFIKSQLKPVYETYHEQIKIDLVPFGFEQVTHLDNGTYEFVCQHGPEECYGNQYHSCAINKYSELESTEFVGCSMSSDDPASDETFTKCAQEIGLEIETLNECYTSGLGAELLVKNGEKTQAVTELIGVPTIVFNNVFNQTLSELAEMDLESVVKEFLN